ncbi:DUF2231 domain-containing protein [Ammonicoccus fulvus]|uniref:DUF2231 domain-containing protein n=1 Tax=Ammonicoccus fulvus TaxID=3138240 RepID=A0ABZ3FNV7_9ACTN
MKQKTTDSPLSRLVLRLEQSEGLDAGVRATRPLVDAATGDPRVRDALQGRWLGHALHPLVVMAPLGTWLSATLLDLSGVDRTGRAARFLTGVGVLSAGSAAATGWAELAHTGPAERRVGVAHAMTNGGAVILQACSWFARRRNRHGLGRACSLAGLTLAGAAGFLGGHLSVARGVGTRDRAFAPPLGSRRPKG